MLPKLAVFDLDGTLVETSGDLAAALNFLLAEEGLPALTADQLRPKISHGGRAMVVHGYRLAGTPLPEGADLDALFSRFIKRYEAFVAVESRLYDGLPQALEQAVELGWQLAICSNKRETLVRQLLEALDIASLFSAVTGGDTLKVQKPHPDHLLGTIAMAKGVPGRSVMIGDASTDVDAAKAAGVPVIGVDYGYSAVPIEDLDPDIVLSGMADLPSALRRLQSLFAEED